MLKVLLKYFSFRNNMRWTSLQDYSLYKQAVKINLTPISAKYIPVLSSFGQGASYITNFNDFWNSFAAPGPHLLVPSYGWGRYKEKIVAEQAT